MPEDSPTDPAADPAASADPVANERVARAYAFAQEHGIRPPRPECSDEEHERFLSNMEEFMREEAHARKPHVRAGRAIRDAIQRALRIRWHAINDGKRHHPKPIPMWRSGRLIVHFNTPYLANGDAERAWYARKRISPVFHVDWGVGTYGWTTHALSLKVEKYGEPDVLLRVELCGCALYLGVEKFPFPPISWLVALGERTPKGYTTGGREWSIQWHSGMLWWNFGLPDGEWHASERKRRFRRRGSFDPVRAVLGKQRYVSAVLNEHDATINLPEGQYPARVRLTCATWTRDRFVRFAPRLLAFRPFVLTRLGADITPTETVPVIPGKGENSWDCDDDAIYEMSCPATTVEAAVASYTEAVLSSRRKHGGANWVPPAPFPAHASRDDRDNGTTPKG